MSHASYTAGMAVVVLGHGVGRIETSDGDKLVVKLDDGNASVSAADASSLLRPVVNRDDAQRFFERLCEACPATGGVDITTGGDGDHRVLVSARESATAIFVDF